VCYATITETQRCGSATQCVIVVSAAGAAAGCMRVPRYMSTYLVISSDRLSRAVAAGIVYVGLRLTSNIILYRPGIPTGMNRRSDHDRIAHSVQIDKLLWSGESQFF
jgi:hypothetical protein